MFKSGDDSFFSAQSRGTSQPTQCLAEVMYALRWTTSRGLLWTRALQATRCPTNTRVLWRVRRPTREKRHDV